MSHFRPPCRSAHGAAAGSALADLSRGLLALMWEHVPRVIGRLEGFGNDFDVGSDHGGACGSHIHSDSEVVSLEWADTSGMP
jgi:hypothetical protein